MIYLLYSQHQNAYHRSTLERMLESNMNQLRLGAPADYIVVAIATDDKEADELWPLLKAEMPGKAKRSLDQ